MTAACPACMAAPAAIELAEVPASVHLSVPSIRCAACIGKIEDHLTRLEGVRTARVNLTLRRVAVETDLQPQDLADALAKIGYDAFPLDADALGSGKDRVGQELLMRLGVAGFAMMNVMLLSVAVWSGAEGATRDLFHLLSAAIALPAALYSAQPFFRNASTALRHRQLNMDVPISLAIILAGGMSLFEALNGGDHAYFDAALSLTFFLLIGRYLEHRTRAAARSAAKELSALEVHTAERKDGARYNSVPVDALHPGDVVLVATGARVPADGTLIETAATTDRSFLTGESDPVVHERDAILNAGEINLGAAFDMRVAATGDDTRLRRIATLVETAENARNSYTSLADRAARLYAPLVHLLAAATFLGWFVATADARHALNIAIAVLIITCPCALGLAVPAVSTAAISKLYRLGFLVKSGTALERLADVDTIVFDKTGTLTKPGFQFDLSNFSNKDLSIAKALAQKTGHPLSKALDQHLEKITPIDLTDIQETTACGVTAHYANKEVALGRAAWLGHSGDGLALKTSTTTYLLPYNDMPVSGAKAMAENLGTLTRNCEIISGDTAAKTKELAETLGIENWNSGVTPEGKALHISDLRSAGATVAMVGDGLNDTAALSSAHASIAPGRALDAARNAADVVLLGENALPQLATLFSVARQAVLLSKQNFGIAVAYNAIAIPIAVLGHATPLMAALAMSASSVTVLANAMRIGARA